MRDGMLVLMSPVTTSTDGPLRGDDEVHAHGAGELPQADHRVLDLGRGDHHEVGELVHDDDDVGQRLLAALHEALVQLAQVAGVAGAHHELVAALHLVDDRGQHAAGVTDVGDDRRKQVRHAVEVRQLDLLGVDHDEAHLVGRRPQQDRAHDAVEAGALARAGCAGDQHVNEPRQVGEHRLAGDVLADPHRQGRGVDRQVAVDVAQADPVGLTIGHLDADRRLAGNGRLHADLGRGQGVGDVVAQRGDPAHLGAGGELQLVLGHARPRDGVDHASLDTEVAEGLGELRGHRLDHGAGLSLAGLGAQQQCRIGQAPEAIARRFEDDGAGGVAGLLGFVGQRELLLGLVIVTIVGAALLQGGRLRHDRAGRRGGTIDVGQVARAVDQLDAARAAGPGARRRDGLVTCGALAEVLRGGAACAQRLGRALRGAARRLGGGGHAPPGAAGPETERRAAHQQESGDHRDRYKHVDAHRADHGMQPSPEGLTQRAAVALQVRRHKGLRRPRTAEQAEGVGGRGEGERQAEDDDAGRDLARRAALALDDEQHGDVDQGHRRKEGEQPGQQAQPFD